MNVGDGTAVLESRYLLPTYDRLPLVIDRGEGVYVYDRSGRRFLDLYGGHAVASTGHSHPRIVAAIAEQAKRLLFYSNVVSSTVRAQAAERLMALAGEPFHQVFFVNSGAEANEAAMRLSRQLTGRRKVVALRGSFHGRTLGAQLATGLKTATDSEWVHFVAPNEREAAQESIDRETAAVILEPIQSMAGVVEPSPEFFRVLRQRTTETGAFLIYDEVQTGAGRTGSYLYSGSHGVHADMVTLAKGIAGGFPMGALLASENVAARVKTGDLGSTFGGGPLSCAALAAALEVYERENVLQRVRDTSGWLRSKLTKVAGIDEVRGRGLLLGIKVMGKARDVQQKLLDRAIITGGSADPSVLRLLPPLVLSPDEAAPFLDALPECLPFG